ncbi:MAG: DUF2065 domain-containing protein [Burkholderiaceae bacterium]|jgi:uncharacterized protein YjeT (DUF2065 family)|nr:DUF2065 domain-containing protein [Burkholderiaceae bacterium]
MTGQTGFWVAALALALVLEGLLPFLSPGAWRNVVAEIARMTDGQIRFCGLLAVLLGLALLWLVV